MLSGNPSVLLLLFFVSTYFINDKRREGIALYTGGVQQVHHHQEFTNIKHLKKQETRRPEHYKVKKSGSRHE